MDDYQNTEEWHKRLNDATWAAIRSWDPEVMGHMSPRVFNNFKPLIKAAILNFLNSAPPKRNWVSLSDEEFRAIRNSLSRQDGWDGDGWDLALKQAIEAALRSKNT